MLGGQSRHPGLGRLPAPPVDLEPQGLVVLAVDLDAHLILGINLASGSPPLAAAEAAALVAGVGSRYVAASSISRVFARTRSRTCLQAPRRPA